MQLSLPVYISLYSLLIILTISTNQFQKRSPNTKETYLDFTSHDLRGHTVMFNISPTDMVPKMVWIHWTVEQIKLEASLGNPYEETVHRAEIASTKPSEWNDEYTRQILNWNANMEQPLLSNLTSMRALVWNCNGASIETIASTLTEMPDYHNPNIVLLLEKRLPIYECGGVALFKNLDLDATTHTDPERGEGGIWVGWKQEKLNCILTPQTTQMVFTRKDYSNWIHTTIYGRPNPRK